MDKTAIINCTDLSKAIGATFISFHKNANETSLHCSSVSIDSRTIARGALFVALAGTVQDGHRFVKAAFEAGAAAVMVDQSRWEDSTLELERIARAFQRLVLVVENTLQGLQEAAAFYLAQFPGLLKIGITGSAGKTTTKEIAAAMIGQEKSVIMNQGNLNSETGLPLSVFMVRSHHEVGIFEMGMNRHGEIAELANILKPHIALITNIGSAHIGFFGSKQAIAAEKKAVFSEFTGNERGIICAEDEYRDFLAGHVKGKIIFYGSQMEEVGAITDLGLQGHSIMWDGVAVTFGLPGKHNVRNALAAAAIAKAVPVSADAIRAGLASVKPLFGRSEILQGPVTVIRDCYNANPESVKEGIELGDSLDWQGRRIYIIGSMLELGPASEEAHKLIGSYLIDSKPDMVCLYGPETLIIQEVLKDSGNTGSKIPSMHTNSIDTLKEFLSGFIRPGDLVLLKGSRGCALEQLTGVLMPDEKITAIEGMY